MSNRTLKLKLANKHDLLMANMPFIREGGIFIATPDNYALGEEIPVILELLDEPTPVNLRGKVVWITPKGAQGGISAGVGVQLLGDEAKALQGRINTYLAGLNKTDTRTDTM